MSAKSVTGDPKYFPFFLRTLYSRNIGVLCGKVGYFCVTKFSLPKLLVIYVSWHCAIAFPSVGNFYFSSRQDHTVYSRQTVNYRKIIVNSIKRIKSIK